MADEDMRIGMFKDLPLIFIHSSSVFATKLLEQSFCIMLVQKKKSMGRSQWMLDRFADQSVISKLNRNSLEIITLSFGVKAYCCKASGRGYVCSYSPGTISLFDRLHQPPDQSIAAMQSLVSRSSFSTSFESSSRSWSSAIRYRAFFRSSDCCLIVPKCCTCWNDVHKPPHGVRCRRHGVPFFDRVRYRIQLLYFFDHHGQSSTDKGIKFCLQAHGIL